MTDPAGIYAADPLMRKVQLGVDVQFFISNDKVGRYLIEQAHAARISALEDLANIEVTPQSLDAIRELQWRAKIPDMFLQWLDEALSEAHSAEETILLEEAAE